MTGINAARADRFLNEARGNIRDVRRDQLISRLTKYCCPERLVRELIYDINNQSKDAERLISPKCIFDWVKKNMSLEKAHHVFYDEDRAEEYVLDAPPFFFPFDSPYLLISFLFRRYKGLDPDKPKDENCYEPFLSPKFLTEILIKMKILREPGKVEVVDLCGDSDDEETSKIIDDDDDDDEIDSSNLSSRKKKRHKSGDSDDGKPMIDMRPHRWQVSLGGNWKDFDDLTNVILESAFVAKQTSIPFRFGSWNYLLDFVLMQQINTQTNRTRSVRRVLI